MTKCIYCDVALPDQQRMCTEEIFECRARTASRMEYFKIDYAILHSDYKELLKDVKQMKVEIERLRAEATSAVDTMEEVVRQVTKTRGERDAARDAARTLLFAVEQYDGAPRPHMVVEHPWLKEREGEG